MFDKQDTMTRRLEFASIRYRELLPRSREAIRRSRELIEESKKLIKAAHKRRADFFSSKNQQR